jgi:BirA family biotin operon repressor/biotin-[acetyl-CoA-carboxylase] ligase
MSTDDAEVFSGPTGSRFGEVRWYRSVGSTNEVALEAARSGVPDGLVVVADEQTAGRGRLGRRWEAPAGSNLLLTVLLRLSVPPQQQYLATVVVALAAADACQDVAGVHVDMKWPNDLLVADRKLGGVLAEVEGPGSDHPVVVVGLGLKVDGPAAAGNVAWPAAAGDVDRPAAAGDFGDFGDAGDVPARATSLAQLTGGRRFDRRALLDAFLTRLEPRVAALADSGGRQRLASEHRRRCATLGRLVKVETAGGDVEGTATDITPDGHLLVDVGNLFRTVTVGDVVHLRESDDPSVR